MILKLTDDCYLDLNQVEHVQIDYTHRGGGRREHRLYTVTMTTRSGRTYTSKDVEEEAKALFKDVVSAMKLNIN